jgi:hypothetical protein
MRGLIRARPLFCTDTVSVSGPKTTAVSLERWVERVQPVEFDTCCLCHIITVNAVFLHNPLVAVGGDSCLCWTRSWVLSRSGDWRWVSGANVLEIHGIVYAGNELGGSRSRCCAFGDADIIAREEIFAVGVGGVPSIEVVECDAVVVGNLPAAIATCDLVELCATTCHSTLRWVSHQA